MRLCFTNSDMTFIQRQSDGEGNILINVSQGLDDGDDNAVGEFIDGFYESVKFDPDVMK